MRNMFSLRDQVIAYLHSLRSDIMQSFESLEENSRFIETKWNYEKGAGGGSINVLRGTCFEKAAVNWSGVGGEEFPSGEFPGPFFATGVSLITHMQNPHMPTVHMNVRYIETGDRYWFGGGYDLTPMGFDEPCDTEHFHNTAKKALPNHYEEYAQNAREYFYIPHRKKERGVGGLFFEYIQDFEIMQAVGNSFLPAIMPIYERKKDLPYTTEDKEIQKQHRAHYVEFNLLYDRGTKFGFASGGNPEAILCSMPPTARW
ncbi:MAG: coproporphyrinogen III oxidase [Chlamydiia bacterium]|nr:coproporphyrinogen III oxidase [Chlamydiia bacterium]